MIISIDMEYMALIPFMGDFATETGAWILREMLVKAGYTGQDTGDVPDGEWETMVEDAEDEAAESRYLQEDGE